MTVEAPAHAEWLDLPYLLHLGHIAMAARAANPGSDVNAVIEIGVFWKLVDANPVNGLVRFCALLNQLELLTVPIYKMMTVHTGLRGGYGRDPRYFHRRVTIATIDVQISGVQPVTEGHRLTRLVTDIRVLRREEVPDTRCAQKC